MQTHTKQAGFTLIEILIVVILLGILATIIVPQFITSGDDAKLSALKTNLKIMREAISLYYYQHDNTFPGANNTGGQPAPNEATAADAFVKQLTQYTRLNGGTSTTGSPLHIFGPYIKSDRLPLNPYNGKDDLKCDMTTTDITSKTTDGSTGWKFYVKTGILLANDGAHDDL